MGHHAGRGDSDARAAEAAALFAAAAKRPSKRRLKKLYAAVSDDSALQYVDGLIDHLRSAGLDLGRIHELGRWLALTGSDRGAVKIGIALLGVTGLGPDLALVRTLGAHEEFTLYAAVAISNGMPNSERQLWELAKSVDGCGRIACVERLSRPRTRRSRLDPSDRVPELDHDRVPRLHRRDDRRPRRSASGRGSRP